MWVTETKESKITDKRGQSYSLKSSLKNLNNFLQYIWAEIQNPYYCRKVCKMILTFFFHLNLPTISPLHSSQNESFPTSILVIHFYMRKHEDLFLCLLKVYCVSGTVLCP